MHKLARRTNTLFYMVPSLRGFLLDTKIPILSNKTPILSRKSVDTLVHVSEFLFTMLPALKVFVAPATCMHSKGEQNKTMEVSVHNAIGISAELNLGD